jgi:hypothetical protein
MDGPATPPAPGCETVRAASSHTVPASGGPPAAYLAPDVPELVELVESAEQTLLAVADDDLVGSGRWWGRLGLAALGASAFPIQYARSPSHRERVHREALLGLRRLRRALAPALHPDPDAARPWWRSPDHGRLVAFRVVIVDRNALDGLAVVAPDHPALECLLAVLVPVDEPDAAALAVAASARGGAEVVLDRPAHDAHRRVAARLLRALHQVYLRDERRGHDSTSRERRTTP